MHVYSLSTKCASSNAPIHTPRLIFLHKTVAQQKFQQNRSSATKQEWYKRPPVPRVIKKDRRMMQVGWKVGWLNGQLSCWFFPGPQLKNMWHVKIDHFPGDRVENNKISETTTQIANGISSLSYFPSDQFAAFWSIKTNFPIGITWMIFRTIQHCCTRISGVSTKQNKTNHQFVSGFKKNTLKKRRELLRFLRWLSFYHEDDMFLSPFP